MTGNTRTCEVCAPMVEDGDGMVRLVIGPNEWIEFRDPWEAVRIGHELKEAGRAAALSPSAAEPQPKRIRTAELEIRRAPR